MKIPVQNIFYLLCYAWNRWQEGSRIKTSESEFDNLTNLFAHVLDKSCSQLFKKGLERNYVEQNQEYAGIKGKIDFANSLNKNLFQLGRAVCTFDEYEYNILINQLIKGTLKRLTKVQKLNPDFRPKLWDHYYRFKDVEDIAVQSHHFNQVRIHKNNIHYDFILKICRFIVEQTVLDERIGTYSFKDLLRDEKLMARIFEDFIRNFYKLELPGYQVGREKIDWNATPIGDSSKSFLPIMQTDTTIQNVNNKSIIETKYYAEALVSRTDMESLKIRSGHLYQLNSYLINQAKNSDLPKCKKATGILLYPTVDVDLNQSFQFGNHLIQVRTLNLNQEWWGIREELLNLITPN